MSAENCDWYERRHELREGDVFICRDGSMVKLDRRVPGDGTQWYVLDYENDHWFAYDSKIEPGELQQKMSKSEDFR